MSKAALSEASPWSGAIGGALDYLERQQLAYGEFRTFIASDFEMTEDCEFDSSPFTTALVLYALGFLEGSADAAGGGGADRAARRDAIFQRALGFLLDEMETPGIWRYWTRRSGKGIAPDADDTSMISQVIRSYILGRPDADEGIRQALQGILDSNRRLLEANRDPSGLFYTWFVDPGQPNDVDGVVNANVVFYLGETPATAAACDQLVDWVEEGHEAGAYWYYTNHWALYYAITRAWRHGASRLDSAIPTIRRKVLAARRADGSFGSPLATALAVCTLLDVAANDDAVVAEANATLVAGQGSDGSWPMAAFYCGPNPPRPVNRFFGSAELTTALCLEALARSS